MQDLIKVSDSILNIETKDIIQGIYEIEKLPNQVPYSKSVFYKVSKLTYEENYSMLQAMENAISVFNECECNLVYFLNSTKDGIELFLGVVERDVKKPDQIDIQEYGKLLKQSIEGHFQGSILKQIECSPQYVKSIIAPINGSNEFSLITGVPSLENEDEEKNKFQAIDRLIHSLSGEEYQIVVVSEPTSPKEVDQLKDDVYRMYNQLYGMSKTTVQNGENTSVSDGTSTTQGSNKGKSTSTNENESQQNESKNLTKAKGGGVSVSEGTNVSNSSSNTKSSGESKTVSVEYIQKEAQDILKYIDEILLERVKIGYRKGFYKTCIHVSTKSRATQISVENSIVSLFQGERNSLSPLNIKRYSDSVQIEDRKKVIKNFKIPFENEGTTLPNHITSICSVPVKDGRRGLACYLTTEEVGFVAGFPTKEVSGIPLNKGVEFGLNVKNAEELENIHLGHVMHMGRMLPHKVVLDKNVLSKHVFVAGVTGSGKTTTCQNLLLGSNMPFLVIEPAKTEYRVLMKNESLKNKVTVFTLGNEKVAPFRINPFEFLPSETITAHVDMLKASFEAAFEMEAAMPQILEASIYRCYEKKGWDINNDNNEHILDKNDAFDGTGAYFPTLSDLVIAIREVVEEQGFDDRLKNDYIGSLIARINGLMVGSKGQMLNCKKSVDFEWIINNNVILELDDLKNGSDKALVMGLVLSRLSESLKYMHKVKPDFKHITLVEEAHRLLSNVGINESGSKRQSVEMFSDMLAEVRKYGECLIIVDQIPNKLAPDVLKNTNTKIIHKIFAKDDKETVGDSMALDDKQKNHLSYLETGETIMFSQGWNKPVQVRIQQLTNTTLCDVSTENVAELYKEFNIEFHKNTSHVVKSMLPVISDFEIDQYINSKSRLENLFKTEFISKSYRLKKERLQIFKNSINELFSNINNDIKRELLVHERVAFEGVLKGGSIERDFLTNEFSIFFKLLLDDQYDDLSAYFDGKEEIFEVRR